MKIGSIVHYVSYGTPGGEFGSQCRAAIIAGDSGPGTAELAVLNPTGLFFNTVAYDEDRNAGTYHEADHD